MHWGRPPLPPQEFLAHATENITLPQTSFAGGKKYILIQNNLEASLKLINKFAEDREILNFVSSEKCRKWITTGNLLKTLEFCQCEKKTVYGNEKWDSAKD